MIGMISELVIGLTSESAIGMPRNIHYGQSTLVRLCCGLCPACVGGADSNIDEGSFDIRQFKLLTLCAGNLRDAEASRMLAA